MPHPTPTFLALDYNIWTHLLNTVLHVHILNNQRATHTDHDLISISLKQLGKKTNGEKKAIKTELSAE